MKNPPVHVSSHQENTSANNEKNSPDAEDNAARDLFVFAADKGMQQCDRKQVDKVIFESSKGSAYFKNQQDKDSAVNSRCTEIKDKLAKLLSDQQMLASCTRRADMLVSQARQRFAVGKVCMHVDLDQFYAAVEIRENPSLAGKPIAVGGMAMISTANYEARKFGVRSAMPGFIAIKLCPQLIFVNSSFTKYREVSGQVKQILLNYDPNLSMGSLDEASMDITQYIRNHGVSARDVAEEARRRIVEATSLTASAGVGPNKMLAKIASDMNKPNGCTVVPMTQPECEAFVGKLAVRKIPGVGRVMEKMLREGLGVTTVSDILSNAHLICGLWSEVSQLHLIGAAAGGAGSGRQSGFSADKNADESGDVGRKSIGIERTFGTLSNSSQLIAKLQELCERLSEDAENASVGGHTVTLKIKDVNFKVKQKSFSLPHAICKTKQLFDTSLPLLQSCMPCNLRLMGVKLSTLVNTTKIDSNKQRLIGLFSSESGGSPPSGQTQNSTQPIKSGDPESNGPRISNLPDKKVTVPVSRRINSRQFLIDNLISVKPAQTSGMRNDSNELLENPTGIGLTAGCTEGIQFSDFSDIESDQAALDAERGLTGHDTTSQGNSESSASLQTGSSQDIRKSGTEQEIWSEVDGIFSRNELYFGTGRCPLCNMELQHLQPPFVAEHINGCQDDQACMSNPPLSDSEHSSRHSEKKKISQAGSHPVPSAVVQKSSNREKKKLHEPSSSYTRKTIGKRSHATSHVNTQKRGKGPRGNAIPRSSSQKELNFDD